jgi:hypothetical protein
MRMRRRMRRMRTNMMRKRRRMRRKMTMISEDDDIMIWDRYICDMYVPATV